MTIDCSKCAHRIRNDIVIVRKVLQPYMRRGAISISDRDMIRVFLGRIERQVNQKDGEGMVSAGLVNQLIRHEGERLRPYTCPAGRLTIGVGRNLEDNGITREESRYLLENDLSACMADLVTIFPGFSSFSERRKWALTDMRFNLGPTRFRGFRKMIAAVLRDDWEGAAREALDSRWAKQVQPERVDTVLSELKEG